MKVKVVAVSQPVIPEIESPEHLITYAARVSNPKNQGNLDTAPKLLGYLKEHKHWSPFEMAHVVMEINTTRDIARQILRHRSFSFQEFSQRYADVSQLGDMFEKREARLQDTKNRQNSISFDSEDKELRELASGWNEVQTKLIDLCTEFYKWALEKGIAKEQARVLLPEGLTRSKLYMSGSVRSWIHYCDLRRGPETQKEHRLIAQECWDKLLIYFPSLKENG